MAENTVLVVGAGPTGLTMAAELGRHGVTARIIDKAPVATKGARGFAIHPRTMELFENMGLGDKALAAGDHCHGLSLYNKGKKVTGVKLDWIASKYPYLLLLPQSETERLLTEHLATFGVEIEREVELVALDQDAASVTVKLHHERDGRTEEATFAYVVGCDGSDSAVRNALAPELERKPHHSHWLCVDCRLEWDLPADEFASLISPAGVAAFFPLPGGRSRLLFELEKLPDEKPSIELARKLAGERGIVFRSLQQDGAIEYYQPNHQNVKAYSQGRTFLAGDAAHVFGPIGVQGINAGIQDAYNLAWKLGLVVRGKSKPALLDSYHEERHRVGKAIEAMTERATKMIGLRNPVLRVMRNMFVSVASKLGAVQEKLLESVSQTEVHYRQSPIIDEDWDRVKALEDFDAAKLDIDAGERVDDFELHGPDGGKTRLYGLLDGAEHEVLLFAGRHPEGGESAEVWPELAKFQAAVADRVAEGLLQLHFVRGPIDPPDGAPAVASTQIDPGWRMHEAFGAGYPSIYIIRPDGYVAYRSQPAAADNALAYLSRIFV